MANDWPVLSLVTFLPLVGCFFIMLTRGDEEAVNKSSQYIALWTSIPTFLISLSVWLNFDSTISGFQMIERFVWIPGTGANYHVGVDGVSVFFILSATFLTPICVLATWVSIKRRVREYMIALLVLETMVVGTFCALDTLMFYCFFEGILIPIFLMLGIWGDNEKSHDAMKFCFYTFLGSFPLLGAVIAIYLITGYTDIVRLQSFEFTKSAQIWLWGAFFISFTIKATLFPFHRWLTHNQYFGPIATTIIMSCLVIKIGGYGFLRFSLPMLPIASALFAPLMIFLGVVTVIYASFSAISQKGLMGLIAYASVAQMGLVTISIFTLNEHGVQGAVFEMLSHSIVAAGLIICANIFIQRMQTGHGSSSIKLINQIPNCSLVLIFFVLAFIGVPGTAGFIGPLLILLGAFKYNIVLACFVAFSLILVAVYMLYSCKRIFFSIGENATGKIIKDLSLPDSLVLIPIIALVIFVGVYPMPFLELISISVKNVIGNHNIITGR